MKSKSKLIYIISSILVATLMIGSILLIGFSFGWFGDKKGADVTIKVSQIKSTVTSETELEPSSLIAGNFFDKTLKVKIESEAEIYLRTYAEMVVQTKDGDRTDLIELIRVTKTRKGRDNKFYYVGDSNSITTINGNAEFSLTYKFYVDSSLSDDMFKDADGNYDSTKKIKITYYFEYCQKEGYDDWGSDLVDETSEKYTITFDANGGTIVGSNALQFEFGETITGLPTATKENYMFTGWQTSSGSTVKENSKYTWKSDITLYAQFKQAKYTITFVNYDGTELKSSQVEFNTMPTAPTTNPTRPSTSQYEYSFDGWTPALSLVTGNKTYTATYTEKLRTYTITFVNYDGTELLTLTEVPYGTTPVFDKENPTRPNDENYIYTFSGWSPAISSVSGNATYTAQYSTTVAKAYLNEVEFKNLSGLKTIRFEKTAPSGYTKSDGLTATYGSNGIEVYYNGGTETAPENISLVFEGTIVATSNKYFQNCSSLTGITFNNFDTSEMTDMSKMFYYCSSLISLDLSKLNTTSIVNMSNMFGGCSANDLNLNVSVLDTSNVTNMSGMFSSVVGTITFGGKFITNNVMNMQSMFSSCKSNLDLSSFDTNKVTNMQSMFANSGTNLDLSSFNTKNVTSMSQMFISCFRLEQINFGSNFNTEKVQDMSEMFMYCTKLENLDLTSFDTSNVTKMTSMFDGCSKLQNLNLGAKFVTLKVKQLSRMFYSCSSLTTLDLSAFVLKSTTGTTISSSMLTDCTSLTTIIAPQEIDEGIEIELPTGQTWYVEGLSTPITKITNLEQGKTIRNYIVTMELPSDWQTKITGVDATKITKIGFENFASNDYTKVENSFNNLVKTYIKNGTDLLFVCDSTIYSQENASSLFANLTSLTNISFSNFELKNGCTSISEMFKDCSALTQVSLANFNTNGVTNMSGLFSGCRSLKNIIFCDNFVNMNYNYNLSRMFENCSSLENIDFKYDTLAVSNYSRMFYGCSKLTILDLGSFAISSKRDTTDMLTGCDALAQIETPIISSPNTITLPTSKTYYLVSTGEIVTEITSSMANQTIFDHIIQAQLSKNWKSELADSSNITALTFANKIPSGYSSSPAYSWTTGIKAYRNNTTNTQVAIVFNGIILAPEDSTGLFQGLSKLNGITFTNFRTNTTTNMKDMFNGCSGLTSLNLSMFDTTNVTDMSGMFNGCLGMMNVNISTFNTESVTDMNKMFYNCNGLKSLTFPSTFKTDKVTNMSGMFGLATAITSLNLSNFNTSNVTDMSGMFMGGQCNIVGLNKFDTSKVTNMSSMFSSFLRTVDVSSFNTSNVTDMSYMFSGGTLDVLNLSNFIINSGCNITNIFGSDSHFRPNKILTPQTFKEIDLGNTYYIDGYYNNQITKIQLSIPVGTEIYKDVQTAVFPTDWKTKVKTATSSSITADNITAIRFEKTVPSGYNTTKVGTITGAGKSIDIYSSTSKSTDIAFVSSLTIEPASCSNLFSSLYTLTTISFNNFDTQYISDMSSMFSSSLTLKSIDLSKFNTGRVTNMKRMFGGCALLTSLDVSGLNTENVTNMSGMFQSVQLASLNLAKFNTSEVTDMSFMFGGSGLTSLNLIYFNTNKVTNMEGMFYSCSKLTSINFGNNFNTSMVTNMSKMFQGCNKIGELNLSRFVTTNVIDMSYMFNEAGISYEELDLSYFEIKTGCNVTGMLYKLTNGSSNSNSITTIITPATQVEITLPDKYYVGSYGAPYNKISTDITLTILTTNCNTVTLPTTWKTTLGGIYTTATKIYFNSTIPSGFTYKAKLDTTDESGLSHIDIYGSGTEIALINGGTIYAPTSLQNMFGNATTTANANKTITQVYFNNFNTSKTTNLNALFANCTNLTKVVFNSAFTTDKVTGYTTAFYNCSKLTELNLSTFEVSSSCTSIGNVLSGCTSLTKIYAPAITNTSRTLTLPSTYYVNGYGAGVTSISNATGLAAGTLLTKTALRVTLSSSFVPSSNLPSGVSYSSVTDLRFTGSIPSGYTKSKTLSNGIDVYYSGTKVAFVNAGGINAPASFAYWFVNKDYGTILFSSLTSVSFKNLYTTSTTDMSALFFDMSNLKSVDMSSFTITSSCDVSNMFFGCDGLQQITTPRSIGKSISLPLDTVAIKGSSNGSLGCQTITSSTTTSTTYYLYNIKNYIKSNKSQYIDTGFKPNNNSAIEIKGIIGEDASLYGAEPAYFNLTNGYNSSNGGYYNGYFYYNGYSAGAKGYFTRDSSVHVFKQNKNQVYYDGSLLGSWTSSTWSSSYNLYLFGRNSSGALNDASDSRIYYCKIWNNGTLVRNFVAVQSRYSSTVIGLYDKANNKLYLNAGSGSFTVG